LFRLIAFNDLAFLKIFAILDGIRRNFEHRLFSESHETSQQPVFSHKTVNVGIAVHFHQPKKFNILWQGLTFFGHLLFRGKCSSRRGNERNIAQTTRNVTGKSVPGKIERAASKHGQPGYHATQKCV